MLKWGTKVLENRSYSQRNELSRINEDQSTGLLWTANDDDDEVDNPSTIEVLCSGLEATSRTY
jgi:hypothetical protein